MDTHQDGSMFCKICCKFDDTGTFVTGCHTFHKTSFWAHQLSDSHKNNYAKEQVQLSKPETSTAEKALVSPNKNVIEKLEKLFQNAHYLAKQGRPLKYFHSLCQLDVVEGLLHDEYVNEKLAAVFMDAIGQYEISKMKKAVQGAKYAGIVTDGSTDSSYTEAEIIYIRYCVEGKIHVKILAIENVPKADASTMTDAILNTTTEVLRDDILKKVVGVGTDGARPMTRKNTGVVQRIQTLCKSPFIIGVH